jgi:hypothetical protein
LLLKELSLRLTPKGNLFLLTNPLIDGREESEIEDMFIEETRSVELGGKKLSLKSKFDNTKFFGKEYFSNYIFDNYTKVDFSGFRLFLNALKSIVQTYEKQQNF